MGLSSMNKLLHVLVALMILFSSYPVFAQDSPTALPQNNGVLSEPVPAEPALQPDAPQNIPVLPSGSAPLTTILPEEAEQSFSIPAQEPFPGEMCVENSLTPDEANELFNLVKDGFLGDEFSGDANPAQTEKFKSGEENRTELPNKNLIVENPSNPAQAANATIPSKELDPFEVSNWLNSYISGPFAFGLVLSDTVRTGRCADANTTDCYLVGKNLKFRNDGTGIVANARPIKDLALGAAEKIKGLFTGTDESGSLAFTTEEQEVLGAGLFTDIDDVSVKTAQRLEKELIANSMFTTDFGAKMGTNCVSDDCVISTYSMFDKYFNQWMSSEMVATTFGPSLLYRTRKLFGWVSRRGSFLRNTVDTLRDKFRANFEAPGSFLGNLKTTRMHLRVDRNGWKDWYQSMTIGNSDGSGYPLIKTQEFQDWWGKQQVKDGFLDSIDTVEKKAEFIRVLRDLRTYVRGAEARTSLAEKKYQDTISNLLNKGIANPYEHINLPDC